MSLTTGRGPHGHDPAGRFNPPVPPGAVYVEPFPRRVRGLVGGRIVIESEAVLLVHRPGLPPSFAFPAADAAEVPHEPEEEAAGHVTVPWDAVEEWFEEEEQVFGHPRNPFHRVDCIRTRRRLRVEVAGVVLVDTDETMGVYETALAPRLYVPRDAVRTDLLGTSDTSTYCPYKGFASYWTATVGDQVVADVAWSYDDPVAESTAIGGMLCFDPARAAVTEDLPRSD